jgi:hypothetical protein
VTDNTQRFATKSPALPRRRRAFGAWCIVAAAIVWPAIGAGAAVVTLEVAASDAPPGFHHADLPRYLSLRMAEAQLPDWRFAPAAKDGVAADRVEWSFRPNPYAGGHVRSFVGPRRSETTVGVRRKITIEARLYLNGEYQTLVEQQTVIQGGPDDPDLAAAVASVTQNLLGPRGAYRAVENGRRPTNGLR